MSSRILNPHSVASEPLSWRRVSASGPLESAPFRPAPPAVPRQPEDSAPQDAYRVEEARRQAFAEGESQGRQAALQQIQTAIERLARSAAEIAALAPRVRREAEEDVVKLALAIARRILRRELTVDPEALVGVVKAALEKIEARDLQRIRVSEDAAPLLAQRLDQMGLPRRVEVDADPSLEPGAAIFETTRGTLDASIDTQLKEIERGFADAMGQLR